MFRPRDPDEPKIYFLPNLMTAGNLVCGFMAVLTIFKGILQATSGNHYDFGAAQPYYEKAILLIFASCIFDLLDGRLARLGGKESPFGQEFDSLADVISFGMAPSMLVAKAVLLPLGDVGWVLACIYVLCGAMRLARFNCLASMPKKPGDNHDFRGIPIPMAAGFIASLTYLIIDFNQNDRDIGNWKYALAGAMFGLSLLMISDVRYPSFKKVGWRTKSSPLVILVAAVMVILLVQFRYVMPVVLFSAYLLYGLLIRPFLSKKLQQEIEEQAEDEEDSPAPGNP
jgi:CDP-diacylglycerol---serine O-phosphatidyltransferase